VVSTNKRGGSDNLADDMEIVTVGWGALPVFDDRGEGYVGRGAYVVPLWEGSPTEVLRQTHTHTHTCTAHEEIGLPALPTTLLVMCASLINAGGDAVLAGSEFHVL
jgi:hypothetical protein